MVDSTRKVLINDKHPLSLGNVGDFDQYPVFHESEVTYEEVKGQAKLIKIRHPRDLRFSGILQIDNNSNFYFISRNKNYDDMNPYIIPEDIEKMLEEYNLFPYSLFKEEELSKVSKKKINEVLEKILVKGYFKTWNLNYRFPIIELEEEIA